MIKLFNLSKYVEDVFFEYGTENLKYFIPSRNVQVSEPNIVMLSKKMSKLKAIGNEVFQSNYSKKNTKLVQPVKNGSISDYKASVEVFGYYLDNIAKNLKLTSRFFGPNIFLSLHSTTTEVEISALSDSINNFNLSSLTFINEGIASKIGIYNPLETNNAIVCNLGAGVTDIQLLLNNEIFLDESMIYGGLNLDKMLSEYVKSKYNVIISGENAKLIKAKISLDNRKNKSIKLSGKDMFNNLPKTLVVDLKEFVSIVEDYFKVIINKIITIMEQVDANIIDGLLNHGLIISGGLSQIPGLKEYFEKYLKLKIILAQDQYSVLKGMEIISKNKNLLEKSRIKDLILL